MEADFEEKEYEIPLFLQLADGSQYVWSPGQVLEKRLGFDGAQFTKNSAFWKAIGQIAPTGIDLNSVSISRVIQRKLPTFKCNLMLQVKRPVYLTRKVRGYTGPSPYYRFEINQEQQRVLYGLASKIKARAYIGYASPAFYKLSDLYLSIIGSNIVSKSNFISVNQLTDLPPVIGPPFKLVFSP